MILGIIFLCSQANPTILVASEAKLTTNIATPDSVCAGCHKEIYEKYERSPMAQASGDAADGLLTGVFTHDASGIRYRVFLRNGEAQMSYDRDANVAASKELHPLHGERRLEYFIGSGRRGRTYLYQQNGQWFETPINFYSKRQIWDMAPNYGAARTMPSNLLIDSNCLHCHATLVQAALPTARNKYNGAPFEQGGIGCIACHGDPAKHLAEKGHGPIVNPATLTTARRDSICLQCHLEGDVAIYRSGKSLADFRAGDNLAEYAVYFVRASAQTGGARATSQYEALLRSACKVASGDKLTCTTCHDPHSSPDAERVAYFRSKCLTCHTAPNIATEHHPEQKDCAICHMPTRKTADISHEQLTDHNIQRSPLKEASTMRFLSIEAMDELVPVGAVSVGDRELGLAYAQLAEHGDRRDGEKALSLLQSAERGGANDAQLHTQLGFLEQMSGNKAAAQREYSDALMEDPYDASALANLAILDANAGHAQDAARLLQRVMDADPSQMIAGLNLAFIECRSGDKKDALEILKELALFSPDDPTLQTFLSLGIYAGQHCNIR